MKPRSLLFASVSLLFPGLLAALTFNEWRTANFTPEQRAAPTISGPAADPDGDGMANLHEYAFFGQPLIADTDLAPTLELVSGTLALTYRERHDLSDVSIRLQGSDTLSHWITYNTVVEADREVFTGYDEVTLLDPAAFTNARRFLRLRVELLPINEPRAPTNVTLAVLTPSTWGLGWTDPNTTETGYAVERRLATNAWERLVTLPADTGNWQHTAADYQTSTTYRVVAIGTNAAEAASPVIALSDADGDGIPDAFELGSSYAGAPGTYGSDKDVFSSNGSGISDGWFAGNGFDPAQAFDGTQDSDGDGLSDYEEAMRGTDPHSDDTDGDGVLDPEDGWPRHAWITQARLADVRYAVVRLRGLGFPEDARPIELDDQTNVLAQTPTSHYTLWNSRTREADAPPLRMTRSVLVGDIAEDPDPIFLWLGRNAYHLLTEAAPITQSRQLSRGGYVAGSVRKDDFAPRAAFWKVGETAAEIPETDYVSAASFGIAVNSSGTLVGWQQALESEQNPDYLKLGGFMFADANWLTNGPLVSDEGLYSGELVMPHAVNDAGIVLAHRYDTVAIQEVFSGESYGGNLPATVTIIDEGTAHDLGVGTSLAITSGETVLAFGLDSDQRGWWARRHDDTWTKEPSTVWNPATQSLVPFSAHEAVNDRLEVVGGTALIRNGTLTNINNLVAGDWALSTAHDINNHGVILATAKRTHDDQGQPIPTAQQVTEPVLLLPVGLTSSHPQLTGESVPEYVVNADTPSLLLTTHVAGAADGTLIGWEITSGEGVLSRAETATVDGFAKTTLTTSTTAGDAYQVTARVKKLVLPPLTPEAASLEFDFETLGLAATDPQLRRTTADITVVPGFATAITVTRKTPGGDSVTALPADGSTTLIIEATVRDAFGQPVAENTPVSWYLAGLGTLAPIDDFTDADGKARATLTAGDVVGSQKVTIEADTFEVVETIPNTIVTGSLTSAASSLDVVNNGTATLTVSVPGAKNGTPVRWLASMGEILNEATSIQNGQATATLRASGTRTGIAQITASVAGAIYATQIEFTSSGPISIEVDNPVIVGDASSAGSLSVPRLDGTSQAIAYPTSTPVRIKAPGYPGHTATVRFGEAKPLKSIRYSFDQIIGSVTPDDTGEHPATVSGATLDTTRRHEGTGSLFFGDAADVVGIPDHADLRLQPGMAITVWAYAAEAHGSLVSKAGEYDLAIDTQGRATFAVVTNTGTHSVTGAPLPIGRWVMVRGEYSSTGSLKLTVDGALNTATSTGTPVNGTATVLVGEDYVGWLDALTLDIGRQFVLGTGLSVSGLDGSNQIVLDANGEATVTLSGNGGATVDAANPVFRVGVQVSINPQLEAEESVVVTTRQAYAVLDATLGDVRIQSGSTTVPLTEQQKAELLAASLRELKSTGQRSAALLLEPSGTMTERQQYGFRAALWMETVDGAEQVKLVMENVDRLGLNSEQEVQLQEQVMRMLMDAIKGKSDAGAGEALTDAHGGLLATLADLSTRPSFQTFTRVMDGRAIFVDLADLHEEHGPELIKDLTEAAHQQVAQNPSFLQRVIKGLHRFGDLVATDWNQVAANSLEDFLRTRTMQAVADEKLTEVEAFAIGFGWGLAREAIDMGQIAHPFAAQRMAEQMSGLVIAAYHGSQEARDALKQMVPVWGLKVMTDEANNLAADGQYFDAGMKSANASTAAIGTATGATQLLKLGIVAGLASSVRKANKGGPPRLPASFGLSNSLTPSRATFADEVRSAYSQYFPPNAPPPPPRMHHAVPVTTIEALAHRLVGSPISPREMHSLANARLIPHDLRMPDGRRLHQHITNKWADWFEKHPTFNKQQLLDFATEIDDLFGHQYTVRVR